VFDEPPLSERYARLIRTSRGPMEAMMSSAPSVDDEYEGHPPRTT
jgi:hypothetical protein